MTRQFWSFVVCGGMAALANVVSRACLSQLVAYVPAIILAYLIGMTTAFLLNRAFVFKQAGHPLHLQIVLFTLINLLAVAQTIAISLLLARIVLPWLRIGFHPELIAHIAGVVFPVLTSFVGHKYLTFSSSPKKKT